ncbi:hypothetical protein J7L05_06090 [bacterium]|nr:hypothetical protein [bacterium]
MKKLIYISIMACFVVGFFAMPASALSHNAEKFLQACTALDSVFPPRNWDKYDLRDAALEVLDEIEDGTFNAWPTEPTDFCLKTLGYTQFPEDVDRIIAYEDDLTYSVLRSLKGFPSVKAIECHYRWLDNEIMPKRELAFQGLADIDFNKLKKPDKWRSDVLAKLINARQKEKVDWLIKILDKSITKVESFKIKKAPKK